MYYESSTDSALDETLFENDGSWVEVPRDCSVKSADECMDRIEFILSALKEESWLPAALRGLILDGIVKLRHFYRFDRLSLSDARDCLSDMAMGCYFYNDLTMKSKTLRHVRVLDMELAGRAGLSESA